MQRSEDKQQACVLAQTMLQIQEMIQEASKAEKGAEDKLIVATEGCADGQISRLLLSGSCTHLSTKQKISAQEASVALEYIDHVKELRDQAADLEKECEENRQACNSAKVLHRFLLAAILFVDPVGVANSLLLIQSTLYVGVAAAV